MNLELMLSPSLRGAPHRLDRVLPAFVSGRKALRIASQQISARAVVEAVVDSENARFLIEGDYLRSSPAGTTPWFSDDSREPHRQAMVALLRLGCEVRVDRRSALQHANLLLGRRDGLDGGLLTSANLSPGSLGTHFNWALAVDDDGVCAALRAFFDELWATAPMRGSLSHHVGNLRVHAGVDGEATDLAEAALDGARDRISFAYFNLVADARVTQALCRASARGVRVMGIVDGDQAHQHWDGVPSARGSGVDVRYYPGAVTGAAGRRMHYKMFEIDGRELHLTTANASASAENSLELAVSWADDRASHQVRDEIVRLRASASVERPKRDS